MKLALCLLALLPVVFSAALMQEDKRFILDSFNLSTDEILRQVVSILGSDATEQGCENVCRGLSHGLDFGLCKSACSQLQGYLQRQG